MQSALRVVQILAFLVGPWLFGSTCLAAKAGTPQRVLIIHSFGRDFAPYDAVTAAFRRELASQAANPVIFLEATLDAGRTIDAVEEAAFVSYLKTRFANPQPPDLIVSIGPPAGQFVLKNRGALFAATPIVLTALDSRLVPLQKLKAGDALVATQLDFLRFLESILRVLPDTRSVAIILGDSTLEKFWRRQFEKESAFLAGRVDFIWFDGLPLEQIKERVAALPAHAVVFYGILIVDAAGIPHERLDALAEIKGVAHSPIFSLFENELGNGVVGGPYLAQSRTGREAAHAALRSLSAAGAFTEPTIATIGMERPAYDGRELARWGIDESRLPPDSEVRFRAPSVWEQHRAEIVTALTVIVAQALLIVALLWQRSRRQYAEREARSLGGRLITAHEDERRRLARELHDDLTQRLAALAIQAAKLDGSGVAAEGRETVNSIRERLVELSEDVHALSYRLHPTVIEDLGLVEALKAECDRVARSEAFRVELDAGSVPAKLPTGAAVGLFRVAQEALRNVARHAKASDVRVALHSDNGRLVLAVQDNGTGFGASRKRGGVSLGLASMRERMRLLDGALDVDSAPGRGTTVTASISLPEGA
jgi:two-component sensor histidine kinase